MGNPGISDDALAETWRVYQDHGRSWQSASRALGISESAFGNRLRLIRDRGLDLPTGARQSIERAGLDAPTARGGWKHIYDEDGRKLETINWRAPDTEAEVIDVAAQMRAAFEGITPAPIPPAPERSVSNLCTLYPLMDVHLGMLAWGAETGDDDYDVRHATQDLRRAFAKVIAPTPDSEQAVLLIGGDFFHADDNRAETPQSRHRLDVDGRHFKVLGAGVQILSDIIETLARKHERLCVRILRGNHDEHSHLVLTFALSERYRTHERITVERDPRDLFLFQWGRSLISAHHGDKGSPEQIVLAIADTCPVFSATRHRWLFTGHTHRDRGRDIGPMRWESLRAFAPKDAYAAGMNYTSRRSLQSLTFDKQDGLVNRSLDPVERAAA